MRRKMAFASFLASRSVPEKEAVAPELPSPRPIDGYDLLPEDVRVAIAYADKNYRAGEVRDYLRIHGYLKTIELLTGIK